MADRHVKISNNGGANPGTVPCSKHYGDQIVWIGPRGKTMYVRFWGGRSPFKRAKYKVRGQCRSGPLRRGAKPGSYQYSVNGTDPRVIVDP